MYIKVLIIYFFNRVYIGVAGEHKKELAEPDKLTIVN